MKVLISILISVALVLLVALQVYVFVLLLKLNESLKKLNTLMDSVGTQLPEILENLRIITLKAKIVSADVERGFKQVSKTMSFFLPISSFFKLLLGFFRKREERND